MEHAISRHTAGIASDRRSANAASRPTDRGPQNNIRTSSSGLYSRTPDCSPPYYLAMQDNGSSPFPGMGRAEVYTLADGRRLVYATSSDVANEQANLLYSFSPPSTSCTATSGLAVGRVSFIHDLTGSLVEPFRLR